ncbi:MAG: DUF3373 domain-containing protein [Acidobacteria bacterium]|nr:DUF3373 domain-containing protein [Acidobacteriota bacterium]
MRKLIPSVLVLLLLAGPGWAQSSNANIPPQQTPTPDDPAKLRQEIEQLKLVIQQLENRVAAQEKTTQQAAAPAAKEKDKTEELTVTVQELEKRVSETEKQGALDRVRLTGDYRFEAHSIWGKVPSHFDGMELQNLLVKTMFAMNILGAPPTSIAQINNTVSSNYAGYQQFTNNLTFSQLQAAMASFPPALQQQLFGMLMPSTFVPSYKDNNKIMYTNRVRLNFDAKVADNVSFAGRLSMYKVFGDSTGVQVFNGQPNTLNIDGTTGGVPNSDQVRVERAYFSWNNIGGSKLYLSIGRRPSTYGPPMNFRQDELRGGTPSGALIDYQFDGITVGYKFNDNMVWRLCYGLGYESGFGNGNLLKMPQDRLKDVHFLGANLDFWTSERTLLQATYAHAFNVTDGFNGLVVMPRNPLTGDPITGPAVLRFTPSTNLGEINLFGVNFTRKQGPVDLYVSGNYSGTRPNGKTTPFGGMMSDPFETPVNRNGFMVLAGLRYNFPNDERTKMGFEFNHGSKYWFNFAQAEDDIIAPKTNTRGQVYETYFTHRINERFIFKADFIKYAYTYSGSGWHLGAPKKLDTNPILGFPTYSDAFKLSMGLIARF